MILPYPLQQRRHARLSTNLACHLSTAVLATVRIGLSLTPLSITTKALPILLHDQCHLLRVE